MFNLFCCSVNSYGSRCKTASAISDPLNLSTCCEDGSMISVAFSANLKGWIYDPNWSGIYFQVPRSFLLAGRAELIWADFLINPPTHSPTRSPIVWLTRDTGAPPSWRAPSPRPVRAAAHPAASTSAWPTGGGVNPGTMLRYTPSVTAGLPVSLPDSQCVSVRLPVSLLDSQCHCGSPSVTAGLPVSLPGSQCHCWTPSVTAGLPVSLPDSQCVSVRLPVSLLDSQCHCGSPSVTARLPVSLPSSRVSVGLPVSRQSPSISAWIPVSLSDSQCHVLTLSVTTGLSPSVTCPRSHGHPQCHFPPPSVTVGLSVSPPNSRVMTQCHGRTPSVITAGRAPLVTCPSSLNDMVPGSRTLYHTPCWRERAISRQVSLWHIHVTTIVTQNPSKKQRAYSLHWYFVVR